MVNEREELEKKIIEILRSLGDSELLWLFEWKVNTFSTRELEQIYDFLNTWWIASIYKFLEEKIKEYVGLLQELKNIRIVKKKLAKLEEESREQKKEEEEVEELLNF
jgi:hypothetical protein